MAGTVRRLGLVPLLCTGANAYAEPAWPPPSAPPRANAAEQAITLYRRLAHDAAVPPPCGPAGANEVVVCGSADGRSPYRLPLVDGRGPRAGARTATGDAAHVGVGDSPVRVPPGTGLTLTLPIGPKAAGPRVTGTGTALAGK